MTATANKANVFGRMGHHAFLRMIGTVWANSSPDNGFAGRGNFPRWKNDRRGRAAPDDRRILLD